MQVIRRLWVVAAIRAAVWRKLGQVIVFDTREDMTPYFEITLTEIVPPAAEVQVATTARSSASGLYSSLSAPETRQKYVSVVPIGQAPHCMKPSAVQQVSPDGSGARADPDTCRPTGPHHATSHIGFFARRLHDRVLVGLADLCVRLGPARTDDRVVHSKCGRRGKCERDEAKERVVLQHDGFPSECAGVQTTTRKTTRPSITKVDSGNRLRCGTARRSSGLDCERHNLSQSVWSRVLKLVHQPMRPRTWRRSATHPRSSTSGPPRALRCRPVSAGTPGRHQHGEIRLRPVVQGDGFMSFAKGLASLLATLPRIAARLRG